MPQNYCLDCGNKLVKDVAFCSKCGEALSNSKKSTSGPVWVTENILWWQNLAILGVVMLVTSATFISVRPPSSANMDLFAGNVMLVSLVTIVASTYLYRRAQGVRN